MDIFQEGRIREIKYLRELCRNLQDGKGLDKNARREYIERQNFWSYTLPMTFAFTGIGIFFGIYMCVRNNDINDELARDAQVHRFVVGKGEKPEFIESMDDAQAYMTKVA